MVLEKQIQRPLFKIQHNSHLERRCVVLSCKRLCEWFWVCREAACGLFVFFGPCVIQRCWNHFICPSPPCLGNYPCVTVPWSFEVRLPVCTVSGCISMQQLIPHKTTTSTDSAVRHDAGVKGSCQSCNVRSQGPRMRSLHMVWTTCELVQSGKQIPSGHFSFETVHVKISQRRHRLEQ